MRNSMVTYYFYRCLWLGLALLAVGCTPRTAPVVMVEPTANETGVAVVVDMGVKEALPTAVVSLPTIISESKPTAELTQKPTPTPVTLPPANVAEATLNGVSFFYDQTLIPDGVTAEFVPARPGVYGMPPHGPPMYYFDVPDILRFTLNVGEDVPQTWQAQFAIQPITDEAGNYFPGYEAWKYELNRLQQFTANPTEPSTAVVNYNTMHTMPLNFSNGRGVRYLTIIPPGPGLPTISNDELYYVYNGLTDDGRYFIYLQFPLTHPSLPTLSDIEYPSLDALYTAAGSPDDYFSNEIARLNNTDLSEFSPLPQQLDNMVATLFVPATASTVSSIPAVDLSQCTPNAAFVADTTIPDGTTITANTLFTKTWQLRNNGSCPLTPAFNFIPVNDSPIRPATYGITPPLVQPGETFTLSVPLIAPPLAGYYRMEWQFTTPFDFVANVPNVAFGPHFYTEIRVNENAAVTPPPPGKWEIINSQYDPSLIITADSLSYGEQICTDVVFSGEYMTLGDYLAATDNNATADRLNLSPDTPVAVLRTTCDIPRLGEFLFIDQGYPQLLLYQEGLFVFAYPR
jgi:hypothetical protein